MRQKGENKRLHQSSSCCLYTGSHHRYTYNYAISREVNCHVFIFSILEVLNICNQISTPSTAVKSLLYFQATAVPLVFYAVGDTQKALERSVILPQRSTDKNTTYTYLYYLLKVLLSINTKRKIFNHQDLLQKEESLHI